jgi:hypothetical protein
LTAVVWRDKRHGSYNPPSEGNFWDEHRNAIKPAIVVDNHHLGYVHRLTGCPIATRPAVKHGNGQKNFVHLLDIAVLNSHILLSLGGEKKILHRDFRLTLVRAWAGNEP